MITEYSNRAGSGGNVASKRAPLKLKILRSFYMNGKPLDVGTIVSVDAHFARELIAVRKAELA
jgi:hypothetical protein